MRKATNIIWDTDGDNDALLNLPTEADLPDEVDDDDAADYLSDKYEFLIEALCIEE